jgi:hypothetical protein
MPKLTRTGKKLSITCASVKEAVAVQDQVEWLLRSMKKAAMKTKPHAFKGKDAMGMCDVCGQADDALVHSRG